MHIEVGFDITLELQAPNALVCMLNVHPDRRHDVLEGDAITVQPALPLTEYIDGFGNRCTRIAVPAGVQRVRLFNRATVQDSGLPDAIDVNAAQLRPDQLPADALQFVLPSRYCEVDSHLLNFAWSQFGALPEGYARVQAVCDFVHQHLRFDYGAARANRTAVEGYAERVGVCRDFAHLAITLCRALNIPARYATGYLGDIGIPPVPYPMDFSAWFEVNLGGRWYTFDARHNVPRIGRIVMARGRDAADVALTTTFGPHRLVNFSVVTDELAVA